MEADLQVIQKLINEKKFKKALTLVNKINKKPALLSYHSLSLEAVCLLNGKKYLLAELLLKKALTKASSKAQKIAVLVYLQVTAYEAGNIATSCDYLKANLGLDGTASNAQARHDLCTLSLQLKRFEDVVAYGEKLFNLSDFAHSSLFLVIPALLALEEKTKAEVYFDKALAEIAYLSGSQVKELCRLLLGEGDMQRLSLALTKTEKKYNHESWFRAYMTSLPGHTAAQKSAKNLSKPISKKINSNLAAQMPKDFVVGSDQNTVALIYELVENLKQMGASFHPLLRIVEDGGDLSIRSFASYDDEQRLIVIPLRCMPILSDFKLAISADKLLSYTLSQSVLNKDAHRIMDNMLAIYNATGKLKSWAATYPLLTLREYPELVDKLYALRALCPNIQTFKKLYDEKKWDELLLESFVGSRKFNFTPKLLKVIGIDADETDRSGLLTVIDFLNHKSGAKTYEVNRKSKDMEIHGLADRLNNEVFVQYNFYDPLVTYLNYGFIENNPPWLFSVPMTLTARSGLSVIVHNMQAATKAKANNELSHIEQFLPSYLSRKNNKIVVSILTIPDSSARDTLVQVLKVILTKHDAEGLYQNETVLMAEVENLEKQLLRFNFETWTSLGRDVAQLRAKGKMTTEDALESLRALCNFSLQHISDYMSYRGISAI